jgi:hypothetical protein
MAPSRYSRQSAKRWKVKRAAQKLSSDQNIIPRWLIERTLDIQCSTVMPLPAQRK